MPWYVILALVCCVIAPFDALYQYIKASRRRDELRRRARESGEDAGETPARRVPTDPAERREAKRQ